ncbi:Putative binding domain-containing protein, N-terminal [Sphingobacterium wenxiniae]|uniref:Putative binding domain-containing protein, N-terminal n=2 Tax=Sphingobacterium wenxiniae TaxID=683125 RepID=A0A1I6NUY8_9SPHI|nr:Putative binding domain-containing protein, N-terminal [Sphingobacterium wenxiniae]
MKLLILSLMALSSLCCSKNDNNIEAEAGNITSSISQINVDHSEAVSTMDVTANREWMVYSNENWITCTPTGSVNATEKVTVTIAANTTLEEREGSVVLKSGTTRVSIPVKQAGKPMIDVEAPEGYVLVWNDEFNDGNRPSAEWFYETGGGGWGNNELQTYVAGDKDGEQLAVINNGILGITAKKIDGTVYSIRMNTNQSWTYGYFEARLKLPKGKGTWPAFWMMPKNYTSWPEDGEIDIMEHVGYDPNRIHSSIHSKAYYHSIGTQKTASKMIPTAQDEFHVYAVEWTEDFIKGYIDGEVFFTFQNDKTGNKDTWPFNAPFYLKLNLAWGGDWGGAQGIDESVLPATYEIDYVRVFQKKP